MILKVTKEEDYELIDSGQGEKLERYGRYTLMRPDPEALWPRNKPGDIWQKADYTFVREGKKTSWKTKGEMPKQWNISFGNLTFLIKPTSFKHTGLFPEQLSNWLWMEDIIKKEKSGDNSGKEIEVLNLFAYTGGATLACARAGAEVCHVDASKGAVSWAKENAKLSGLEDGKIKWIVDDCIKFLRREVNRNRKYDAIVMDPPAFGHGPKDELWKIEEHFLELLNLCARVLHERPLFVLINGYTAGYSAIAYHNCLMSIMKNKDGIYQMGELVIEESDSERQLPAGIFARWSKI
jgi:23S rRNA (cytosine1962-C5)-methyltransferase